MKESLIDRGCGFGLLRDNRFFRCCMGSPFGAVEIFEGIGYGVEGCDFLSQIGLLRTFHFDVFVCAQSIRVCIVFVGKLLNG